MKNCKINFALICFFLIASCRTDSPNENLETSKNENEDSLKSNTTTENLNISFLLDLSDRINPEKYPNPTMDFYKRDIAYINAVSDAFYKHLKSKKVRLMNDNIQVFFDPEPLNTDINKMSQELKFSFTRKTTTLQKIEEVKKTYQHRPIEIYEQAIKDNEYVGSDTWKFFKTKVKDYCIENEYRNILIVLTDGYLFDKKNTIKDGNQTSFLTPHMIRTNKLDNNNWESRLKENGYGFIPATRGLDNLEILVLGINPDTKNPFEEDVIVKYWSDWFDAMDVKNYEIKGAELPSNMEKIIKDFILK